jgi:hypothetical protein
MNAVLKKYLPFLAVCLLGVSLYAHTLEVPFYLDDFNAIVDNRVVEDLGLAFKKLLLPRGLSIFTFALNYRFGELNVVGYHLTNIAIHLVAGCLSLLLLRRMFPQNPWLQLFGALIFVAHPLQTQGVTYLSQRMASLSAVLFLLAIYLFVRAREVLAAGGDVRGSEHLCWYVAALFSGGLAIIAKENAVVLPVVLFLFARSFPKAPMPSRGSLLAYTAPFAVLPLLAILVYYGWPLLFGHPLNTLQDSGMLRSMEGNSPLRYLSTQCRVLWIYIRMFFLPYGQALDHGYPVASELLTVKSAIGGLGLTLLGLAGWQRRRRQPAIAFGIGWFFLTLVVESTIIPLDPLFEHRLYLPIFGLSVCVVALLALVPRMMWQIIMGVSAVLILALLTWQRNALWNDPVVFYEDNFRKAPNNERVIFNLGQQYIKVGRLAEAELLIGDSIAMNPRPHFGYLSLKELYLAQGRIDEAISMLHYGIEHAEKKGPLYNELAAIYGKQGDFIMAIDLLQAAIAVDPQVVAPYLNLAQMALFAGDQTLALQALAKALQLSPNDVEARAIMDNLQREGADPDSP